MSWKETITELLAYGLTQQQIADACNCRQTTISALYKGATEEPRFSLGRSLLALLKAKREEGKAAANAGGPPIVTGEG